MAASYGRKTTAQLIDSIKKRASIPTSQRTYKDEDILRFANEEMDNVMIPLVLRTKEEFYVVTESYPLTQNSNNEFRVSIPYRAIGSRLRNLYLQSSGGTKRTLTRIEPEHIPEFDYTGYASTKTGFYLEADDIVLVNSTGFSPTDVLKVSYYFKPNDLVVTSRVPSITLLDTPYLNDDDVQVIDIYLTSLPTHFEIGEKLDFIENEQTNRTLSYDVTILDVNDDVGGEVRVTVPYASLSSEIKKGDHVAIAGETKVPQLPADLHAMLAQATACRILEAQGEESQLKRAEATLQNMLNNALALIDSRTESAPQKILNVGGFLKRKRFIP